MKKTPKHLLPQGKFPPVRTFHQAPLRWMFRFWLGRFRRHTRPCPNCTVVGTYKRYGIYWLDIPKRRWLCKWCGYMDSVAGQEWCVISSELNCWVGADSDQEGFTPQQDADACGYSPWVG